MEKYTQLVTDLINQEVDEYTTWNSGATRRDALEHMRDEGFEDLFGNLSGSRTYSTYEAQKFIAESNAVWDDDIRDLYSELGDEYLQETLAKGAETFDVVTCELVGSRVLSDMIAELDA